MIVPTHLIAASAASQPLSHAGIFGVPGASGAGPCGWGGAIGAACVPHAGAKYGLSLLGLCSEEVRLPLVTLTDGTKAKIKAAMEFAGVL